MSDEKRFETVEILFVILCKLATSVPKVTRAINSCFTMERFLGTWELASVFLYNLFSFVLNFC